jgi:hypothetical protein
MRTPVSYKIKDFYKSFVKKTGIKLAAQEYYIIVDTAGQIIADILLEEGEYKLGGRGGHLVIRMVKPKGSIGACVDWKATKERGELTYNMNDHSNGYIARVLWERDRSVFRDKRMWLFKPVRHLKRALKHAIVTRQLQYPIYHNRGSAI